jgi:glycerate 2-kinase
MIDRALTEAVMGEVIAACDPAARVREALGDPQIVARLAGRRRFAIAVGKAALAMARGAGEVVEGVAVVPGEAGGELPRGWRLLSAAHPEPDERSVAAGRALQALVRIPRDTDVILALMSGGASALAELPRVPLDDFVATIRGVMAAGAVIDEINAVRGALSAIKAGQLALAASAPIVTLAISDVIGDSLAVIGSGPTIGAWLVSPGGAVEDDAAARRSRARAILERHGVAVPLVLAGEPAEGPMVGLAAPALAVPPALADAAAAEAIARLAASSDTPSVRRSDHAVVIAPMASAARAAVRALAARGIAATLVAAPMAGEVSVVAHALATLVEAPVSGEVAAVTQALATRPTGGAAIVAWGEPTLRVPPVHGTGGRAQQLALALAGWLRGTARGALVVGTDGIDGPPPAGRSAPAGAWVDGTTWDRILAAGHDPAAALASCDAGTVLDAVGALVVTGPSGINHADLVILG